MSRFPRLSSDTFYAGRFTAFTDHLLLGALVFATALPVVTWFAALTAGAGLSRAREVSDTTISPRTYLAQLREVLRSGPGVLVVPTVVLAVLVVDMVALHAGLGASTVATALVMASALAVGVVALRSAALYTPGAAWSDVLRRAARLTGTDLGGSALLVGALLTCALVGTWVPPMVVVLAGPLCLAAAAVTARQSSVLTAPQNTHLTTAPRRSPS